MPDSILVIAEQQQGSLNPASLETFAAAQAISRDTGWSVEIAILGRDLGPATSILSRTSASKVYALESSALASYTADAYVWVLKDFLSRLQPRLVLLPHTYQVRDFIPCLALALGKTVIADIVGYTWQDEVLRFTRQMFQGKFLADVGFTESGPLWMATVQSGAFRAESKEQGSAPIETLSVQIPAEVIRVHPEEVFRETKQAVDLTQSEVIVAVGRGIKDPKNLPLAEQLAQELGGELGASRPICDAGWLPLDRQIGSSGQTVSPRLYIALGISGAIQHIVGIKASQTILAINQDAEAPIFEIADIGVVANLFDVVPSLIEEIRAIRLQA